MGIAVVATLSFLISCQKDDETADGFDRGAMLVSYADDVIVPAFSDLHTAIGSLKTSAVALTESVSEDNLVAAQNAWKESYRDFQFANAFNFGPAGESGTRKGLAEEIATFPVSTDKIENTIAAGSFNFDDFNRDARGFLAVEYLLFPLSGDNHEVLQAFAATSRGAYLIGLIENMESRVGEVLNAWNTTYRNEFVSKTGTDAGSATAMLYNEFVRSYEAIKNFKVALPLGLRAGQTGPEPSRVEALYSGTSAEMLKLHYQAIENIWNGKAKDGADGIGFKEYLEKVEGGPALINSTETQMVRIRGALNDLPDSPPLSMQITDSPAALEAVHTELQSHIRYFKSDMSSLLGISITYDSGDGD